MPNVGSIFRVDIEKGRCRYFWCVGTDSSQLISDLIVVFRQTFDVALPIDLDLLVASEVDFYCHVLVRVGKKQGLWQKVGSRQVSRTFSMLFRDSNDYGDLSVRVSQRWYVWEPNRPFRIVDPLAAELSKAEIGVVFPPECVVTRMRTGSYGIVYPAYSPDSQPCA